MTIAKWIILLFIPRMVLAQAIDLSKAKPLKVVAEKEGIIFLEAPSERTVLSPFVVFVRPVPGGDFEIVARGKVETSQDGKILVEIVRDSILKYPLPGDLAVSLGTPQDWPSDYDPKIAEPNIMSKEIVSEPDPGYVELSYGLIHGDLESSASDGRTNQYKTIPKYTPTLLHFAWYFEFLWRFGLEFDTLNGNFPTSTYYHNTGNSTDQISSLSLNFRFRKTWLDHRLRPALRVISLTDQFTTLNPDEALISSSLSARGLGFRMSYERDSMVWKPDKGSGFKILQGYFDFNYYPLVAVTDAATVQRGTSSAGSTIMEFKAAVSTIFYINWIPLLKRYNFEIGYSQRISKFSFQGPTVGETGGFYLPPQNMTSTEKTNYYYVSLGLRFEDVIGRLLKPR